MRVSYLESVRKQLVEKNPISDEIKDLFKIKKKRE